MPNPTVITPAVKQPVELVDATRQLRVDFTTDDVLITELIQTATKIVERFLRGYLIDTIVEYTLDRFPDQDYMRLPSATPLDSIISLTYTDSDNTATVWAASNYFAATKFEPGRLYRAYNVQWPSVTLKPAEAIVVRYKVGYGENPSDVPQDIRHAILATIDYLYHERGFRVMTPGEPMTQSSLPFVPDKILWPLRRELI